ncbi:MAG: (Fe-S)-binding protein [Bacteroidales bacterium]
MKFDWFVLPFLAGLTFVLVFCCLKFYQWIQRLPRGEKDLLKKHVFSPNLWISVKEIMAESLLHHKIFRTHSLLGYMHASLAFGWFLLIVIGNIEVKFYTPYAINPPYVPIFLNFFEPHTAPHFFGKGFRFIMDFLLLIILSGVALAFLKRFRLNRFGMQRTVQHHLLDKLAIISLWCIFPARLLAESLSAAMYHNGSFLTNTVGKWLSALPVDSLLYPAWWGYSIVLGVFFFALPFSRYMHIPTEVLLIILRNAGIRSRYFSHPYQEVETHACSRCGICIDACQLAMIGYSIQPAYYLRSLRYKIPHHHSTENCLLCGRCVEACPVGIFSTEIRRHEKAISHEMDSAHYDFAPAPASKEKSVEILYFAGCMTHLVPAIKKAMITILNQSGYSWQMLDANESVCCGRPLLLAGQIAAANQVIINTRSLIERIHARMLVTSCPICLKTFKENYRLRMKVLHHTQFINLLQKQQRIDLIRKEIKVKYHDPCELGRGMNVYNEPREVLNGIAHLLPTGYEKEKALCCGGSLGNTFIDVDTKQQIAANTLQQMNVYAIDYLVTACPLCQKTFSSVSAVPVKDIAELTAENITSKIKNRIGEISMIAKYEQ